eukprot:5555274-Pyramimonas_sp.AAC.1
MELHWDKFQMMKIRSDVQLYTPAGQPIPEKHTLTDLGATLYNTGQMSTERNRRIGAAWAWKHTAITVPRKLELLST